MSFFSPLMSYFAAICLCASTLFLVSPSAQAAPVSCMPFDYQLVMQAQGQVMAATATDFEGNNCALQLIQNHQRIYGNEYDARDLLQSLIGLAASGTDLKRTNKQGQTPLHIAAEGSDSGVFSLAVIELLATKTKIEAVDKQGKTPLLNFLSRLSSGVGMNQSGDFIGIAKVLTGPASLNRVNSAGQTPLMLAAQNGSPELVQYLIQQGALVNLKDKQGRNALDYAAAGFSLEDLGKEQGKFCSARLLIQAKSTIRSGILTGWQDRINTKCLS